MKKLIVMICLIFFSSVQSQIRWRTTREGRTTGNTRLEYSNIIVTVHDLYVEVEEEAYIRTTGNVSWGDPNTLEIFGAFSMSQGTAIRSMLLWNGDVILKAKLKTQAEADSAYEDVVDRDVPDVVVIDPAIIEHLGNNRYSIMIYPVAINGARKIRIRYTVPLVTSANGPEFTIRTAFSNCSQRPSHIPVEFRRGETSEESYIFGHGRYTKTYRTLQFNSSYQIESDAFLSYLSLKPDVEDFTKAFLAENEDGEQAGYYAAIFATVPDTIVDFIDEDTTLLRDALLEAKISAGDRAYLKDVPTNGGVIEAYLKSSAPWDSTVVWTLYDSTGRVAFSYTQAITPDTSAYEMLPFLWACKYSLSANLTGLGAVYGFVDQDMSLLALESDSMSRDDMELYADEGVPLLLPDEIIIDPSEKPAVPRENIIFSTTGVTYRPLSELAFRISVDMNGWISLVFDDQLRDNLGITIFDARGRVVHRWDTVEINGTIVNLQVPENLKGVYFMRIRRGNDSFQQKLILR